MFWTSKHCICVDHLLVPRLLVPPSGHDTSTSGCVAFGAMDKCGGLSSSDLSVFIDKCMPLRDMLARIQERVVHGAVVALIDACRTETGLAVTSVEGSSSSRYVNGRSNCFAA